MLILLGHSGTPGSNATFGASRLRRNFQGQRQWSRESTQLGWRLVDKELRHYARSSPSGFWSYHQSHLLTIAMSQYFLECIYCSEVLENTFHRWKYAAGYMEVLTKISSLAFFGE